MTGTQVEAPEMTWAGDHSVPDQPAGKRDVAVRAAILDRPRLPVSERHADRVAIVGDLADGALG